MAGEILQLRPAVKDYLWGGDRLKREWHLVTELSVAAEAWVLSCHPDGPSVVVNGALAGMTLPDALERLRQGADVDPLGSFVAASFSEFPILTKLIDARDHLSIQVHPDDAYAREHEGQFGKTEMWFILDAEPGAYLYYGFQRELDREEFVRRIKENTLLEVLNAVPVKRGDVFFIPPGTLHAIGKGILIAEIQQNSNVTYRVYDYDRRDAAGNPRELHIDQALAVTRRGPAPRQSFDPHIANCRYFTVDRLTLDGRILDRAEGLVDRESFLSVLVIGGEGRIHVRGDGATPDQVLPCRRGDSFFLPAGAGSWGLEGAVDVLATRIVRQ